MTDNKLHAKYTIVWGKTTTKASFIRAQRIGHLHWADFDRSGRLVSHGAGNPFVTPSDDELKLWKDEVKTVLAKMRNLKIPLDRPIYIRYGRLPKSGQSKNHATNQLESGVSAYLAEYDPNVGLIRYAESGGALGGAAMTLLLQGKTPYLLVGEECGIGSDGEPLLKNARILCTLKPGRNGFELGRMRKA